MRKVVRRGSAAVAAVVTSTASLLTAVSTAGAATHGPPRSAPAVRALAAPGTPVWVRRYDGPGKLYDLPSAIAVSPISGAVFVTGGSEGTVSGSDYATIAYSSTGARMWVKRFSGPGVSADSATSVAVSPDGRAVFVTGYSEGTSAYFAYTVAYKAATGARLWVRRLGSGDHPGQAAAIAVSPSGRTVFVAGDRYGASGEPGYATIAYNARTGARLWGRRYASDGFDHATALAVSPGGATVFVTGTTATVAYSAATGATRWVSPNRRGTEDRSVAVSPAGNTVFVTGTSYLRTSLSEYSTVAYRAATGTRVWARHYNGPGNGYDIPSSLAVSPSGQTVFVTGHSKGTTSGPDYATIAYRAGTGATLWVKRYTSQGDDYANSLAVNPDGAQVFVTGESAGDYATVAYRATTGTRLWVSRYNGPNNDLDEAVSVAVDPPGDTVFVTGNSTGLTAGPDYATIAYKN